MTKRGPDAFKTLCDISDAAFKILNPKQYHWQMQKTKSAVQLKKYKSIGTFELKPFLEETTEKATVKLSTKFHQHPNPQIKTYSMRSPVSESTNPSTIITDDDQILILQNRGVLFMVNNINFISEKTRSGAERDGQRIINLFRQMGFTIFYYQNIPNWTVLNELLEQLAVSEYLRTTDCFVFGIMTHGNIDNGEEVVNFSNTDTGTSVDKIYVKFDNRNCKYLRGKPKVFIMPYCRGSKLDEAILSQNNQLQADSGPNYKPEIESRSLPTLNDMIICHGTVPGNMK